MFIYQTRYTWNAAAKCCILWVLRMLVRLKWDYEIPDDGTDMPKYVGWWKDHDFIWVFYFCSELVLQMNRAAKLVLVGTSCDNLCTNGMKNERKKIAQYHVCPQINSGLHCSTYQEIQNWSRALRTDLLYRTEPKSLRKYGKHDQNFICLFKWSMAINASVFMTTYLPSRKSSKEPRHPI